MWHVSSRSGVATLRTAIHLLLTHARTHIQLCLSSADTAAGQQAVTMTVPVTMYRVVTSRNLRSPRPILSVFFALIVHSELKRVHPGFPVAFIFLSTR